MRNPIRRLRWAALSTLGLAIAWAAPASAVTFTLQELTDGTTPSFQSGDGSLTFSDFDVVGSIGVTHDLTQYLVTPTAMGFRFEGPIASDGDFPYLAALFLAYTVTADPQAGPIAHAGVEVGIETTGEGKAGVWEWWKDPNTHAVLESALLIGQGIQDLSHEEDLSEHERFSLRVKKKIFAIAHDDDHRFGHGCGCGDGGFFPFGGHRGFGGCEDPEDTAAVLWVEQSYWVEHPPVPEPAALVLIGTAAGFGGLLRRRRS